MAVSCSIIVVSSRSDIRVYLAALPSFIQPILLGSCEGCSLFLGGGALDDLWALGAARIEKSR